MNKLLGAQNPQQVLQKGWDHPGALAMHCLLWMIKSGRCKDLEKLSLLLKHLNQLGSPSLELFTGMPIASVGESKDGRVSVLLGIIRLLPVMIFRPNKLFNNGNTEVTVWSNVFNECFEFLKRIHKALQEEDEKELVKNPAHVSQCDFVFDNSYLL